MRTVYLGTSDFAVAVLRRLAASPHRPQLVVSRPDRARGRGRRLLPPPVAEAARELDLPLAQPDSVNAPEARVEMDQARPEALIVCAFGALIKEPLLSEHPILNVHPSLLPRWRGAAPIERAIMAGDTETGVCIMKLTAGLDSGPVLLRANEPIAPEDDYGSLAARLAGRGGDLLVQALDESPVPVEQPADGVTYAEKISAEDRRLAPSRPAEELERVVRALHPHIGAFLEVDGAPLGVRAARVLPGTALAPGELDLSGERPVLACSHGSLELLRVQPAGRREMSGEDFLRGRRGRG